MKKIGGKIAVVLAVIALLGVYYYVALPAVNIHATEFWIFLVILVVLAALIYVRKKKLNRYEMKAVSYTHLMKELKIIKFEKNKKYDRI